MEQPFVLHVDPWCSAAATSWKLPFYPPVTNIPERLSVKMAPSYYQYPWRSNALNINQIPRYRGCPSRRPSGLNHCYDLEPAVLSTSQQHFEAAFSEIVTLLPAISMENRRVEYQQNSEMPFYHVYNLQSFPDKLKPSFKP
jgi:hypothetical protein